MKQAWNQHVNQEGSSTPIRVSRWRASAGLLGLAAGVALAGCGTGHPAAQGSTASGSPAASRASAASPSLAARVHTWDATYAAPALKAVSGDLSQFETDAQNQDFSAVQADCQQLQADVATAKTHPRDPDARSRRHYSAALKDLASAARDCVAGARTADVSLVNQGDDEMGLAGKQLLAFDRRLKQVYGET